MTTIKAQFSGTIENLRTAKVFAVHHTSTHQFAGNSLFVSWICEETDYEKALQDCMDSVKIEELESLNIRIVSFN